MLTVCSRRFLHVAVVIALVVGGAGTASAAGWFDNFDDGDVKDGDPVTWDWNQILFTPGIYDASSGDFELSAPDDGIAGSTLVADVDTDFNATYVRAQAVIVPDPLDPENDGGNAGVVARLDPFSFTGYSLVLDMSENGFLTRTFGGSNETLWEGPVGILPDEDFIVELNVIGDLLEGYFWRPGEAKPDTPIVSLTDPFPIEFESGIDSNAGVVYIEDDDKTMGTFRWATAQDTPFIDVDPEDADFNDDDVVDGDDFLIWQGGFGSPGMHEDGDANFDGNVDGNDFLIWQSQFGSGEGAGSAAVPEPASLALAAVFGLLAGCALRRHRM